MLYSEAPQYAGTPRFKVAEVFYKLPILKYFNKYSTAGFQELKMGDFEEVLDSHAGKLTNEHLLIKTTKKKKATVKGLANTFRLLSKGSIFWAVMTKIVTAAPRNFTTTW